MRLTLLRTMERITEIKGVRAMTKVDIDWIISFLGGWLQYVGCISGRWDLDFDFVSLDVFKRHSLLARAHKIVTLKSTPTMNSLVVRSDSSGEKSEAKNGAVGSGYQSTVLEDKRTN